MTHLDNSDISKKAYNNPDLNNRAEILSKTLKELTATMYSNTEQILKTKDQIIQCLRTVDYELLSNTTNKELYHEIIYDLFKLAHVLDPKDSFKFNAIIGDSLNLSKDYILKVEKLVKREHVSNVLHNSKNKFSLKATRVSNSISASFNKFKNFCSKNYWSGFLIFTLILSSCLLVILYFLGLFNF